MNPLTLQDVSDALWSLVQPTASIDAIAKLPVLPRLNHVVAYATEDGLRDASVDQLAGAFRALLVDQHAPTLAEEPTSANPPNQAKAVLSLLGLAPGTGSMSVTKRKTKFADWMAMSLSTAKDGRGGKPTHFQRQVQLLADAVFAAEMQYELDKTRQRLRERRRPSDTALGVDWLARFEDYYRLWSALSGLVLDLRLALRDTRASHDADARHMMDQSLWFFVCFLAELDAFSRKRGGLWLLPTRRPADESALADSLWLISKASPFRRLEESELRVLYRNTDPREVSVFLPALERSASTLRRNWHTWVQTCTCRDVKHGNKRCRVHQVIRQGALYNDLVDSYWDELADWYEFERPAPLDLFDAATSRHGA